MGHKYAGGHAIMLAMPPIDRLARLAETWIFGSPEWTTHDPADYHLTLQFVGRDLGSVKVTSMIAGAFFFAENRKPLRVEFTGGFEVFGTSKGRYLVATVNPESLIQAKHALVGELANCNLTPKDSFAFKPHVTLAEAPPSVAPRAAPAAIGGFTVEGRELVVKYGSRKMVVELEL